MASIHRENRFGVTGYEVSPAIGERVREGKVLYLGTIPDPDTFQKLWQRFEDFEVEEISIRFEADDSGVESSALVDFSTIAGAFQALEAAEAERALDHLSNRHLLRNDTQPRLATENDLIAFPEPITPSSQQANLSDVQDDTNGSVDISDRSVEVEARISPRPLALSSSLSPQQPPQQSGDMSHMEFAEFILLPSVTHSGHEQTQHRRDSSSVVRWIKDTRNLDSASPAFPSADPSVSQQQSQHATQSEPNISQHEVPRQALRTVGSPVSQTLQTDTATFEWICCCCCYTRNAEHDHTCRDALELNCQHNYVWTDSRPIFCNSCLRVHVGEDLNMYARHGLFRPRAHAGVCTRHRRDDEERGAVLHDGASTMVHCFLAREGHSRLSEWRGEE